MPRTRKYRTNGERQAAYRRRCAQTTDVELMTKAADSPSRRRRWKSMINTAYGLLDYAAREMQDYFDEHSQYWQDSPAGESLAEMLESVQDAVAALEDVAQQSYQSKTRIT